MEDQTKTEPVARVCPLCGLEREVDADGFCEPCTVAFRKRQNAMMGLDEAGNPDEAVIALPPSAKLLTPKKPQQLVVAWIAQGSEGRRHFFDARSDGLDPIEALSSLVIYAVAEKRKEWELERELAR